MKRLVLLVVLFVGMILSYRLLDTTGDGPTKKELYPDVVDKATRKHKKATLTPGRVVELQTSKGKIDFVLFEKDCPKTTTRIADLVKDGKYDGVRWGRVVKDQLIQCDEAKKPVRGMNIEVLDGLKHAKGTVGLARANTYNSGTSAFYILMEPWPHLNHEYTAFGRVIRGIDVAMKIRVGDKIKHAGIRPFNDADKAAFNKALTIEAEREVN